MLCCEASCGCRTSDARAANALRNAKHAYVNDERSVQPSSRPLPVPPPPRPPGTLSIRVAHFGPAGRRDECIRQRSSAHVQASQKSETCCHTGCPSCDEEEEQQAAGDDVQQDRGEQAVLKQKLCSSATLQPDHVLKET